MYQLPFLITVYGGHFFSNPEKKVTSNLPLRVTSTTVKQIATSITCEGEKNDKKPAQQILGEYVVDTLW